MKKTVYIFFVIYFFFVCCTGLQAQIITTIAGSGATGYIPGNYGGDGGAATLAKLSSPADVAIDAAGNLFISDQGNNRIRKITAGSGIITTIAGTGTAGLSGDGGPAAVAELSGPQALTLDGAGNIYVADFGNRRVRKINSLGIISTIAGNGFTTGGDGGPATAAGIEPSWIAVDGSGNVYISTGENVRKVNSIGIITNFAGNGIPGFSGDGGPATAAQLLPYGIATDKFGNLYIADAGNYRIRKVDGAGIINTIAGNGSVGHHTGDGGPATAADINPELVAIDAGGNVYLDDFYRERKVNTSGIITAVAGTGIIGFSGDGGPATAAEITSTGYAFDGAGNIYMADYGSNRIRKIYRNSIPYFTGGVSQAFSVCENSAGDSINAALAVIDSDIFQSDAWSALSPPLHGSVTVAYSMSTTGGMIMPTGSFYKPVLGYSGKDTFKVRLTDGIDADTITIYVTVNPVVAIAGNVGVCMGQTTVLSDGVTGGTWSSAFSGIASVGTATGIVTGIALGTSTITYTNPSGCPVTTTVTVNSGTTAISGFASVCKGSTTALSDGIGGGLWSSSNTAVATVGSGGIISGISAGTTIITYTLGTGCQTTKAVTVNSISIITGGMGVCASASIPLSDSVSGGTWISFDPEVGVGSSTGIVTGVSLGTATIIYTTPSGCTANAVVTVSNSPTGIIGNLGVCKGETTSLTDAVGGGTWTSSNTSFAKAGVGTGTITGVNAGNAIITYSLGSGCTVTGTVTVYALPNAITGTATVCPGSTTALSSTTTGGTWTPADGGVVAVVSTSGKVTGLSVGTDSIIYTVSSTGCATTKTVTVNPLPVAITGSTNVCVGATTALSDDSGFGTWKSSSLYASVGLTSGVVTGASPGASTITFTLGTGCITTTTLTVNPAASGITGVSSVCVGATTNLFDGGGGNWTSGNIGVAGIDAGTGAVTGTIAGTATITYTLLTGCATTKTVTVNPLPLAISGSPEVCVGLTTVLSDAGGGTWSSPAFTGIVSVGTGTGYVTGKTTGSAMITYTLPTGCAAFLPVMVNPLPSAITGTANVCGSLAITLSDTTAGGVWTSSNTTIAIISGTGTVTGKAGGLAVITYSTAAGCLATKTVSVNPAAPPITGVTDLCAGTTLRVYDADTTYGKWTSTFVTITKSGLVTTYDTGIGTITYTLPTGCFTTASLTVNPLPPVITGTKTVCTGYTIALTDTATGGIWSPATGGNATVSGTGVVSGITAGTAVISYSLPTGCMTTDMITVYPSPSAITGTANVCAGASTTWSDTLTGGTWSLAGGIAMVGSGTGLVTGISVGMTRITYTTGGGCMVTKTIAVLSAPAIHSVTGGGTYCAGGKGYAVDLGGSEAGIKYLLYDGGIPVDSLPGSGSLLNFGLQTLAGIYKVVGTNIATLCNSTMTDSAVMIVNPLIRPSVSFAASPSDTVCAGTSVTFNATPVNGGLTPKYGWKVDGLDVGTGGSTYSYVPVDGDVVIVAMTSDAICASPPITDTFIVMTAVAPVAPAVIITADPGTSISKGQSVTFTATVTNSVPSVTYQWLLDGTPLPGENNATYTSSSLANNDTVSCMVTANGVCIVSATEGVQMRVNNVGVKNIALAGSDITILPNPNKGEFIIKGTLGTTNDEEVSLEITDMLGQVVYKNKVVAINGNINERIQLSNTVANGMYLLNIHSGVVNNVYHIVVE